MGNGEFGLSPARWELSETEIVATYGPLIQGAVAAFGNDHSYLVDMTEHASLIEYKRQLWKARTEASTKLKRSNDLLDPESVREAAYVILAQWGVRQPSKLSRGSRRRRANSTV